MTRAEAPNLPPGPGRPWTPPRCAAVRWRVGAVAAGSAFEITPCPTQIEIQLCQGDKGAWHGKVLLITDENRSCVLRDTDVTAKWTHDAARGMVHLDAESFLHATIDISSETTTLVYARTSLLGELGLGGGRYQLSGVDLDCHADRSVA